MKLSALLCNLAKMKYYLTDVIRHRMPRDIPYATSEDYWNERAKLYDRQYGRELLLSNLEAILREDIHRYKQVMELGCGIGGNLRALASRFPQILFTGVDHSERMLDKAKDNLSHQPHVRLIHADLEAAGSYLKEKQDLVFSRAVLQHLQPAVLRRVVGHVFEHVTDRFYLEELSIRDYSDGQALRWPGFPRDLYYSHDYLNIVGRYADVRFCRYKRVIILQLFCVKQRGENPAGDLQT